MKFNVLKIIYCSVVIYISLAITACNSMMNIQNESSDKNTIQQYPNDDPSKDFSLVTFEQDKLEIGLPQEWQHVSNEAPDKLAIEFVKQNGSRLLVFCYNASELNTGVPEMLRSAVEKTVPNAEKAQGPWKLSSPTGEPVFELYNGSLLKESIEITMDISIAWYDVIQDNPCQYGLVYTAASKPNDENVIEFLSIVRSARN